jgi:glyoxylase-like metal-dependent hydrolase (beta-lactamase superfamily II)
VAFADLPLLRSFETGGLIHAPESLVLGAWENRPWVPVRAAAWLPLGEPVDLGGLSLELIHTPGHSPDSISLLCRARNILLAADVLYPGPLYAQVPQASLPDYLTTVQRLARLTDAETVILCGHGATPESPAPRLARTGLLDLARTLAAIRDGTCRPTARDPFTYEVNAAMTLLAAEASFAPWQVPE